MKRKCIICGREFDAGGNVKSCSPECRKVLNRWHKRRHYSQNTERYRANRKEYYRQNREACLKYSRWYDKNMRKYWTWERQLAAELAYWNYLIEKYSGGATCKS